MFCWGYDVRGGDGNYFIAGIVPAIVLGTAEAWRRLKPAGGFVQATFLFALLSFAAFQAGYSLLSATWNPGTRSFDLDFARGVRDLRERNRTAFAENGIARIDAHLRSLHRAPRAIGCSQNSDRLAMRLPASVEGFQQLSFARPGTTDTVEHFLEFLVRDRIKYLIVPTPQNPQPGECRNSSTLLQAAAALDANPQIPKLRDQGYVLYGLSTLQ